MTITPETMTSAFTTALPNFSVDESCTFSPYTV